MDLLHKLFTNIYFELYLFNYNNLTYVNCYFSFRSIYRSIGSIYARVYARLLTKERIIFKDTIKAFDLNGNKTFRMLFHISGNTLRVATYVTTDLMSQCYFLRFLISLL